MMAHWNSRYGVRTELLQVWASPYKNSRRCSQYMKRQWLVGAALLTVYRSPTQASDIFHRHKCMSRALWLFATLPKKRKSSSQNGWSRKLAEHLRQERNWCPTRIGSCMAKNDCVRLFEGDDAQGFWNSVARQCYQVIVVWAHSHWYCRQLMLCPFVFGEHLK